jgi:RNA polymerase sigma-32 factor
MSTAKITAMTANTATALVPNNLPIPSALGSLDAYIGAVHQIPVLSVDDEQALARRFREQ